MKAFLKVILFCIFDIKRMAQILNESKSQDEVEKKVGELL